MVDLWIGSTLNNFDKKAIVDLWIGSILNNFDKKAMVDLWIGSRHIVGRTLSEENPARASLMSK